MSRRSQLKRWSVRQHHRASDGNRHVDSRERAILESLDRAVRSARQTIESIVTVVDAKLHHRSDDVLAWQSIPLHLYATQLPEPIRSSWVFVLRANVITGAERHPNSHQRMLSYRGRGDLQTQAGGKWYSHQLRSEPDAPLNERWISIPVSVWHQGVVGPDDWAVVSFHTVSEDELIEERPAIAAGERARQRKYAQEG